MLNIMRCVCLLESMDLVPPMATTCSGHLILGFVVLEEWARKFAVTRGADRIGWRERMSMLY